MRRRPRTIDHHSEETKNVIPTALNRTDDGNLVIEFDDGSKREYSPGELRKACPCATCREKKSGGTGSPAMLPVLSIEEARPLAISSMRPVGNYAYNIAFSDGHDSGIFTFDFLTDLGVEVA